MVCCCAYRGCAGVCACFFVCCMRAFVVKRCMLLHGVLFVMVSVVCVMFKQRLCVIVWCCVACCLLFSLVLVNAYSVFVLLCVM